MMKRRHITRLPSGFTLIELLLYTTVAASLVLVLSSFFSLLVDMRIRQQVVAEVEEKGLSVLSQILQDARNAESIISPATSTSAGSLTLNMPGTAINTITYDSSAGVLRVARGNTSTIAVTNNHILATDVLFSNVSRSGTRGTLRVGFTLQYAASTTQSVYSYSQRFTGSATIRIR
jgi:type II secretory pathway pseudopilin PulG